MKIRFEVQGVFFVFKSIENLMFLYSFIINNLLNVELSSHCDKKIIKFFKCVDFCKLK